MSTLNLPKIKAKKVERFSPEIKRKKMLLWLIRTSLAVIVFVYFWEENWVQWAFLVYIPFALINLIAILRYSTYLNRKQRLKYVKKQKKSLQGIQFNLNEILRSDDAFDPMIILKYHLDKKSNFGKNLSKLSDGEKAVYYVKELEIFVTEKGVRAYFMSSSGGYVLETIEALTTIKAYRTVEIFQECINEFPNKVIPSNLNERRRLVNYIEVDLPGLWSVFEYDFYQYEDSISNLLFNYVKGHANQFR